MQQFGPVALNTEMFESAVMSHERTDLATVYQFIIDEFTYLASADSHLLERASSGVGRANKRAAAFYAAKAYLTRGWLDGTDYEADKEVWRKIYRRVFLDSEELEEAVEEQSIYWADDLEVLVSFVVKTIKRFDAEAGAQQALLPMFKDEDDRRYGERLLECALKNEKEYLDLINENTLNWELDRIAFMDILVMQVALAELCNFPTIPVNVTLNEYIEISKQYSTDKSGIFINGVLDKIVNRLKADNKLMKVVTFDLK